VQVARGYFNRPKLTEERFIRDPFADEPAARLYKTGDLARYLPDGCIEYLKRMDHQVKIRGFRIEPGELESSLNTHPGVKAAAVVAQEYDSGDRRLVAYLVPDDTRAGTVRPASHDANPSQLISDVRRGLSEELPEYMMPAAFVLLDELPLTPNGKLDRRALPMPSQERPSLEQPFAAPKTTLERYLVSLWCDVLKLDRVGIHDKFFELGGDSIQAAQIVNRIQQDLGEFIYVITLFQAPTVAEYSQLLEKEYQEAICRKFGLKAEGTTKCEPGGTGGKVDRKMIQEARTYIPTLEDCSGENNQSETRNPPAVFILSPPRSGTTLLRVMLAGHPELFAAPELQLLGFNSLAERKIAFKGKFSLWLEGTVRTLMECNRCDADQAKRLMEEYEAEDLTTKHFYRVLQAKIGDRTLVDKSPSYALDPKALRKAERDFRDPLYIHLTRHPYPMVRSFEEIHMDQVLFLHEHPYSVRQLGELVWAISHMNIVEFLEGIPQDRQVRIRFEDLVARPREVMEDMCERLNLEFHEDLLDPYKEKEGRMTDGIHAASTPMGDMKFHKHGSIQPEVADKLKEVATDNFLGDVTWSLAKTFGYEPPGTPVASSGVRRTIQARRARIRARRERREAYKREK
jgi:aryl carrier-like protein